VVAATRDLNVRQIYLPCTRWYAILTDDGLENEGLEVFEPPRKKARFGISDISHQCKLAIGSPGQIIQPVCLLVLHVAFWAFQLRVGPSSTGKRRKFCPQTQWNPRTDTALRATCCALLGSAHSSFFGRSVETSDHDLALYLCSLTCDADHGSRLISQLQGRGLKQHGRLQASNGHAHSTPNRTPRFQRQCGTPPNSICLMLAKDLPITWVRGFGGPLHIVREDFIHVPSPWIPDGTWLPRCSHFGSS
jgi:hypothetical protein